TTCRRSSPSPPPLSIHHSTKDSACRSSRRSPAASPLPAATPLPSPRSPATPPSSSTPRTPMPSPPPSNASSTSPTSAATPPPAPPSSPGTPAPSGCWRSIGGWPCEPHKGGSPVPSPFGRGDGRMTVRILLNALFAAYPNTGTGEYLRRLATLLAEESDLDLH